MEIEGHPTQDLLEELETRGAILMRGSSKGPAEEAVMFVLERFGETAGQWMFLPAQAFMTGLDELPG